MEQEFFNAALFGIRKQGRASMAPEGRCFYRSPDGCKCAAGHIITDAEYHRDMDEGEVGSFGPLFVNQFKLNRLKDYVAFIRDLQGAHDMASCTRNFMVAFEDNMLRLARRYNLTYSPPE